jgi:hypothetical protein
VDPLSPKPPQDAYFDKAASAWIVSRHGDVLHALRETALLQERGKQPPARAQILSAIPSPRVAEWQIKSEVLAHQMIAAASPDRPLGCPVDLMAEVLQPWSREIAILALRDGSSQRRRLLTILHGRAAAPGRPSLRARLAKARFEFFFRKRPSEKSAFIGISETLPAFLANAWVALLRHPPELRRLRRQPELMASAMEELLRYAGLVHSLVRYADTAVDLAGVRVAAGDRVILKIASANRDPAQFADPDRLDLSRRSAGHLALGHGEHSCVGAFVLRAAGASITRVFVERYANAGIAGEIDWRWGSTLVSPGGLPVAAISQ